jgi:hypothetical protein
MTALTASLVVDQGTIELERVDVATIAGGLVQLGGWMRSGPEIMLTDTLTVTFPDVPAAYTRVERQVDVETKHWGSRGTYVRLELTLAESKHLLAVPSLCRVMLRCGLTASTWNPDRCPDQATHVLRSTADAPRSLTTCARHTEQFSKHFPHVVPIAGLTDLGQTQPRWTVGDRLWWVNKFTATHSTAYDIAAEVVAEPTQLFMVTAPTSPTNGMWQYTIRFTDRNGKVSQTWVTEDSLALEPPKLADR